MTLTASADSCQSQYGNRHNSNDKWLHKRRATPLTTTTQRIARSKRRRTPLATAGLDPKRLLLLQMERPCNCRPRRSRRHPSAIDARCARNQFCSPDSARCGGTDTAHMRIRPRRTCTTLAQPSCKGNAGTVLDHNSSSRVYTAQTRACHARRSFIKCSTSGGWEFTRRRKTREYSSRLCQRRYAGYCADGRSGFVFRPVSVEHKLSREYLAQ